MAAPNKRTYMRCVSYCTATSYNLNALSTVLRRKGYFIKLSRDVLHVTIPKKLSDIFIFSHGCFVCWGLTKTLEKKWLDSINEHAVNISQHFETDHFCYQYGEETTIDTHDRFKLDLITLDSDNPQIKLAISYGLAQSIKLEAFEDAIQVTIRHNSYLPEEMRKRGTIPLSRRSLLKRIGEIFSVRSSINLSSEYLDVPEFFWRNPHLEPFYISTKKFLDIPGRVMSLNQKLDVLQELLDILNSQVQHQHSSLLETIIILLILIEILISLLSILFLRHF